MHISIALFVELQIGEQATHLVKMVMMTLERFEHVREQGQTESPKTEFNLRGPPLFKSQFVLTLGYLLPVAP